MRRRWLAIAIVLGIVFFALGLSQEAYDVFSPPSLSWHILLRKVESVAAFFVLGYALDRAVLEAPLRLRPGTGAGSIALYSAALEVAQRVHGSHEGLGWNLVDTLCGAVGGALADVAIAVQRRAAAARRVRAGLARRPSRRR